VTEVKAFLGCTGQMSHHCQWYALVAAPLHHLTRKAVVYPKPWIPGATYDVAFWRLKSMMLDQPLLLWNKLGSKRLFIEVDASQQGWGACAYQYAGEAPADVGEEEGEDEGRFRLLNKDPKRVIQWISKAWTPHEQSMPCFYRESLARLLALDHYRNLIETQETKAGTTVYTDHLPALKEANLSNKGQLSTWRIHETADLMSIVQTLFKPGSALTVADALSRIAREGEELHSIGLPLFMDLLLKQLPDSVRETLSIRVNAEKDTPLASRIVQKWRKPRNTINTLKMEAPAKYDFLIAAPFGDKITHRVADLIRKDKPFAILMALSLLTEIDRKADGTIDLEVRAKRIKMPTIVMSNVCKVWLINHPTMVADEPKHSLFLAEREDKDQATCNCCQNDSCNADFLLHTEVIKSLDNLMKDGARRLPPVEGTLLVQTRAQKLALELAESDTVPTPKNDQTDDLNELIPKNNQTDDLNELIPKNGQTDELNQDITINSQNGVKLLVSPTDFREAELNAQNLCINCGENPQHTTHQYCGKACARAAGVLAKSKPKTPKKCQKEEVKLFSFANSPRPDPLEEWVGNQDVKVPSSFTQVEDSENHPKGLLVYTTNTGKTVIPVPKKQRHRLVLQEHQTLLHVAHARVAHSLSQNYFWPDMNNDIKKLVKSCRECHLAFTRRKILAQTFTPKTEQLHPRQAYGIDFYGHAKGEILVAIDLCTREVTLWFLKSRKQDLVCRALLSNLIFQKGVPLTFRNDNAAEFVHGVVKSMNEYLGIEQIDTGGYNARGNATVERFMQHLTANLTKCSDKEYNDINLYLQAIAFAHNTTFSSVLNCTPFEAGHGLKARSVSDARMSPRMQISTDLRGNEEDCVTHWDTTVHNNVLELATRFSKSAVSQSEWHRKMTAEARNQSGKPIENDLLKDGMEVYFYKPPSQAEVIKKGRKAKHLEHYHGPAVIVKKIRTRSYEISYNGKTFKRDAGMLVPVQHLPEDCSEVDPSEQVIPKSSLHREDLPFREGEIIVCKGDTEAEGWYVAEISKVLDLKIQVRYFHTPSPPLEDYSDQSEEKIETRLSQAHFRRTWYIHGGMNHGKAVMTPPFPNSLDTRVWEGPIDKKDWGTTVLLRNVGITGAGTLEAPALKLAVKLPLPHNHTPVMDNTSEIPVEVDPQVYFQHVHRALCSCPKCSRVLNKVHGSKA
jgi:transposase InsO family protein